MDKALKASNEFDSSIRFLARAYAAKKRGTFEEEKALRNNKRLDILMATYPVFVIKSCGPYFLKYADIIQKKKFDEVMKLDFNDEKETYKNSKDGSKHSYEAMDGKIKFLKNMFKSATEGERQEIVDHLELLLSSYCKFALAIKSIDDKKT